MTAPLQGRCPLCGYAFDSAALVGGEHPALPDVGDASLCLNCGAISIYTPFGVRRPTTTELAAIMAQPDASAAVDAIHRRGLIR